MFNNMYFVGLFVYYSLVVWLMVYLNKKYPTLAGFDITFIKKFRSDLWSGILLFACLTAYDLAFMVLGPAFFTLFEEWGLACGFSFLLAQMQFDESLLKDGLLMFSIATVFFPVYEEIIFRGFIQDRLSRIYSPGFALFAQAVCFAAWHHISFFYSLYFFTIGLIFGYWRYKRCPLFPLIFAHCFHNLLSLIPDGI